MQLHFRPISASLLSQSAPKSCFSGLKLLPQQSQIASNWRLRCLVFDTDFLHGASFFIGSGKFAVLGKSH